MDRCYVLLLLSFFIYPSTYAQKSTNAFAVNDLSVQWEVVENFHKGKREFLSAFTLNNTGKAALPSKGWSIFFNFPRMINSKSVTGNMNIQHINGDFYRMYPSETFRGMNAKDTGRVEFIAGAWAVNVSDAPASLYMVWDSLPDRAITLLNYKVKPSTTNKQFLRYEGDKMQVVTAEDVFRQNKNIKNIPEKELVKVFPTPVFYRETEGAFILDNTVSIIHDALFKNEANYLVNEVSKLIGKKITTSSNTSQTKIIAIRKKELDVEAYELIVTPDSVAIFAGSNAGAFYAVQSLKTLIPPLSWKQIQPSVSIPAVEVKDQPRFPHRAFMLDVARHFHRKEEVLKILDLMSLYKLNVFHLHFNDDEGWRLEIPGLPELTQVGGRRGHTTNDSAHLHPSFGSGPTLNNYGSGFYTAKDFIDILQYANERHIRVIPEIETPGHARAAIASMNSRYKRLLSEGRKDEAEQYLLHDPNDKSVYRSVQRWTNNVINVAMPSTYRFLEKVVDEIRAMYEKADVPLETIHFGGDEVPSGVWTQSHVVQQLMKENTNIKHVNDLWYYYYGKINEMMKKKGMYLYGWEEVGMRKTMLDGKSIYIPNPDFGGENVQVDVWNNVIGWGAEDLPYQLANAGYKVVLSPVSNMYFDLAYHKAFDEPGAYWAGYLDADKPFYFIPFDYYKNSKEDISGNVITQAFFQGKERITDYGKQHVTGIQGLIWSETVRSPNDLEYLLLPKLLSLAERAWAKDPEWAIEKDSIKANQLYGDAWSHFVNALGKRELQRLDYYSGGFNYRIPTAGVSINGGKVNLNAQFPGLYIRYTTNGSEPVASGKLYTSPITEKGTIKAKIFNSAGRGGRTVSVINK